ncbi:hypothetical protein [Craterilacuibacter sp. RT1T]|uniref:hypothetical protein n=1 Tax=Craterilacuibacter sp. RT1T TaxID=2942211 RepID=UPI0020C146D4|nr:hypothetical protein [Craterilacuibacter sp. RT1T]MCL6262678.1 hypothetical protein [Craterilacuibacter sp. RT1T]
MKALALCLVSLALAGCASTTPDPAAFTRDWQVIRGQWQALADGTLHGSCIPLSEQHRKNSCGGNEMAVLRSRLPLPANYRVETDVVVHQGVLAELMLSWHDVRFSRFVLYDIDKRAYAGVGYLRLPDIDRGVPSQVQSAFELFTGRRYRLAVNVCNKQMTAWVDGQPLLRHSDPKLAGGVLGLRANGSVNFSRLRVKALDNIDCPRDFAASDFMRDAEGMRPADPLPFCFSC